MTTTLIILGIAFIVYMIILEFYIIKKFKVKRRFLAFSQKRKGYSLVIDIVILTLFVISFWVINGWSQDTDYIALIRITPIFALFFLLGVNRGLEEWIFFKEFKTYYIEWSGAVFYLTAYTLIVISTMA